MSATTQCPTCNTRFKITQAQLDAREGMVRCGRCQAVFDARPYLQGDMNPPAAREIPPAHKPAEPVFQAPEAAPPEPVIIPPAMEAPAPEPAIETVPAVPAAEVLSAEAAMEAAPATAEAGALPEEFIQTASAEIVEAPSQIELPAPEIHMPEATLGMAEALFAEAAPQAEPAPLDAPAPAAEAAPQAEPVFQEPPAPVAEIGDDAPGSFAAEAVEPLAAPEIETPDMSLDMTQLPVAEAAPPAQPEAEPAMQPEIPAAEASLDMTHAAPQEAAHGLYDDIASAWAAAETAAPASEPAQAAAATGPVKAAPPAIEAQAAIAPEADTEHADEMRAPEVGADATANAPRERNRSTTLAQSVAFDVDPEEVHEKAPPKEKRKLPRPLLWGLGSLILLIALAGEGAYFFRVEIAAAQPGLKPALVSYCNLLRCTVPLPQKADLMDIESSELKADPERSSVIALYALLRNRASYAQGYPVLELTLTDAQEKP